MPLAIVLVRMMEPEMLLAATAAAPGPRFFCSARRYLLPVNTLVERTQPMQPTRSLGQMLQQSWRIDFQLLLQLLLTLHPRITTTAQQLIKNPPGLCCCCCCFRRR
jgi:hypothetical protein